MVCLRSESINNKVYDTLNGDVDQYLLPPPPKAKIIPKVKPDRNSDVLLTPVSRYTKQFQTKENEKLVDLFCNLEAPNPIIFHEWFLHCLYHFFSFSEIGRLSRVFQNHCIEH